MMILTLSASGWLKDYRCGHPIRYSVKWGFPWGSYRGSYSVFNFCIILWRTKGYHACMELIWVLRRLLL